MHYLLIKTVTMAFKFTKILLERTLSTPKQSQYGHYDICNVIQSWILWNNGLTLINAVTVCHIGVIFDTNGYIGTIFVILNAINSNCIHKRHINGSGYKLDQNKIIWFTLKINTTNIVPMATNSYKFISKEHKMHQLYQIGNKVQNFKYDGYMDMILGIIDALLKDSAYEPHKNGNDEYTLDESINHDKFATKIYKMDQFYQTDVITSNLNPIITVISVIDQIKTLIAVYLITCETLLSIFTHDTLVLQFKFMMNQSRKHLSTLYLKCLKCNVMLQTYLACDTSKDRSQGSDTSDANTVSIDVSCITNYKWSIIDLLTLKCKLIIIIGYHLDTIDPIAVENEFIIIIGYHLDTIHPIAVEKASLL